MEGYDLHNCSEFEKRLLRELEFIAKAVARIARSLEHLEPRTPDHIIVRFGAPELEQPRSPDHMTVRFGAPEQEK